MEVHYKVLEHYVNPMSSYHFVQILRWIFNYPCFSGHTAFLNSYKQIPKQFIHQIHNLGNHIICLNYDFCGWFQFSSLLL